MDYKKQKYNYNNNIFKTLMIIPLSHELLSISLSKMERKNILFETKPKYIIKIKSNNLFELSDAQILLLLTKPLGKIYKKEKRN